MAKNTNQNQQREKVFACVHSKQAQASKSPLLVMSNRMHLIPPALNGTSMCEQLSTRETQGPD